MKYLSFLALLLAVNCHAVTSENINEVKHDKFSENTKYTWYKFDDVRLNNEKVTFSKELTIVTPDHSDKIQDVKMFVSVGYMDGYFPQFDSCHYVDWLVDGKHIKPYYEKYLPTPQFTTFSSAIDYWDMLDMIHAKSIEVRICNEEYSFSHDDIKGMFKTYTDFLQDRADK